MKEKLAAFERLLNIMDDLRNGCPWDKKQTFESLKIPYHRRDLPSCRMLYSKRYSAIKKNLAT